MLFFPWAAFYMIPLSNGSTFLGISQTAASTKAKVVLLKERERRVGKCGSFTNEDEESSLVPAQQHDGKNTVSISHDQSAAPPFQSLLPQWRQKSHPLSNSIPADLFISKVDSR